MVNEINVKALREGLGLSQAKFASALGVSQSVVCRWEKKGAPKHGAARQLLMGFALYGTPAVSKGKAA